MKRLLCFALAFFFMVQPVTADDKTDADQLIKNTVETVFGYLRNKGMDKKTKLDKIMAAINPVFDFPLMAKLTLGRKYWPRFKGEKRKEFTELFISQLQQTYFSKVEMFTEEEVEFEEPVQVKKKIHIPTNVISKGDKIKTVYKLYKSKGKWKIYDVEVQGVSIISSFRSQYKQILKSGTVDDLLSKMRELEREKN